MIFVFIEDGTLDVIENLQQAQRDYEGIDVESDVYVFYDEDGNYLKPNFTIPNKSGRYLGILPWTGSGAFELVRTQNAKNTYEDPIWLKLSEVVSINSNPWFKTLEEVKAYLRNKGAIVDRP